MRYIISLLLASTALPALAEVPRVVTDMPPVHSITAQVMGDLGQPELLLDRGANAHSYQLRPSQAASLANANLILWIGPEMTPWMARALDGLSPEVPRLALLAADGTFRRSYGDTSAHDHDEHEGHGHADAAKADVHDHDGHAGHGHDDHDQDHADAAKADAHDHDGHASHSHDDHDHADEAKADAHDHDGHEDHSHSGVDPHAWLDPANARVWAGLIAAELSRLDPDNAATYSANAAAAQARIDALDAELAALLAPAKDKPFVVYHDAYGYFASHYGLTVAGSVSLGDASSPGAARLRDLSATVAAGDALCLFPEAQHDPALVTQMADGTSARIGAALDPSGSSIEPGPDAYDALMRALATNIVACLNG
ncbi:zinc ABC transporter substrate-binding protein [Pseudotabrizicola sp.]|uniref:zinc ABC transporter substrate-binding protein n=1 Tax=Pseudotabrizicola sp. TaxID=2939647 RepID=UPI00272552AF|nr:zinc ABC transporter substrate-binding protein [Pseudotabrizicola sp.]MDO8882251.1 zinc ABC transporter substrate-binding protein [Pseudotabrizicola sp.]MDP2082377.1 zinc ABC transporter substrate-binding protein [Pseudotabrizicola sp.]